MSGCMSCVLKSTSISTQQPSHRYHATTLACPRLQRNACKRCQPVQGFSSSFDSSQPQTALSRTCLQSLKRSLPFLLAGSVAINTVAGPQLLGPLPATASTGTHQQQSETTAAWQPYVQPAYTIADAPGVHAEEEAPVQLQWWQQDQQVWQEIVSPAELTAYLSSSQPPPAWPALDSSALNPKLRLVEFYATWCPACKVAAPGMAEVAGDPELRQHCSFARVNIDRVKPMVRQLGITKIPTVLLLGPDGATLASFRASGQAARDAVVQEVAAMQQQQPPPLLPPVLPPGPDDQPAPSEVEDGSNGNGSSSNGSNGSGSNGSNSSSNSSNGSGSNGSNSGDTSSAGGAATCGVTPEPSCGSLPPGVAPPGSSRTVVPSTDANPTLSPSTDPQPVTPQPPPAAAGSAVQSPPPDSSSTVMPVDEALLAAKQQFMQQYGSGYGYGGWLDKHYQQEIGARLGPNRHYLDYTGAALYPTSLLDAVYKDLLTHSYGNPHSAGAAPVTDSSSSSSRGVTAATPPAAASEAVMEAAAAAVLQHMHADPADYQVVFTRSATEALKLVGEMFPWRQGSSSSGTAANSNSPTELDLLSGRTRPQSQAADLSSTAADGSSSSSNGGSSSNTADTSASRSQFVYTRSNHNSVLGIGAYAAAAGAELVPQNDGGMEAWVAGLEQQKKQQEQQEQGQGLGSVGSPTYSLLAYPAEDNYAGVIYPLDWISRVHSASSSSQRTLVLLDAAAYLPTHELDLSAHPADFVVASFYKMFGYPTGLGVLVLRTEHTAQLNKVYFGGGSVALATPEGCWHVNKCDPAAALSDGTPNYLGAAALKLAYDSWDSRGGMQAVQQHTDALSSWLHAQLTALRHSNGAPVIQLYGRHSEQPISQAPAGTNLLPAGFSQGAAVPAVSQGAVFNFQVLQPDGRPVSFSKVDRDATAAGIYLRSGCVCNPGACYDSLGLEASEVQALAGLKEGCGDDLDFTTVQRPAKPQAGDSTTSTSRQGAWWPWQGVSSSAQQQESSAANGSDGSTSGVELVPTEVPLGSVRASLGWASTFEDAYALVQFLRGYVS